MSEIPPTDSTHIPRRYSALWDSALDGLVIFDSGCAIEDANPAFCELVGYTLDELRRLYVWDIDESGEALVRERLAHVAAEGSLRYTSLLRTASGKVLNVRFRASSLRDEACLFFAWARDRTGLFETRARLQEAEQRQLTAMSAARNAVRDSDIRKGTLDLCGIVETEETLRTQGQELLRIFDAIPEVVFVTDEDRSILYFNRELTRRVGVRPDGRTVSELFDPDFVSSLERLQRDESGDFAPAVEVSDAKLGGDFMLTRRSLAWPDGRLATLHIAIDITDHKKLERSLRESEARFRATFEQAAVGIAHVAPDGSWLRVNQRLCDILGYSYAELSAMTFQDITHPEDLHKDLGLLERLLAGEIDTYSMQKRYFKKGGSQIWVNLTVALVRHATGEPHYCISVIENIETIKRAEAQLAALADELRRSNDELESFASVVSHDLQEPLRVVAGYLQIIESRNAEVLDASSRDYIRRAVAGAGRMQELIRDLLELARTGSKAVEPERFAMNALVADVCEDLRSSIEASGARIESEPLPLAFADRMQIRQLLHNLVANAIKFRRGPGPRVRIRAEDSDRQWVLVVEDDGIGIDEAHRERIFEVFARLHSRKKFPGTGIGLAICRRIAERHGGRIWVESTPGKGSTFRVAFPRVIRQGFRI